MILVRSTVLNWKQEIGDYNPKMVVGNLVVVFLVVARKATFPVCCCTVVVVVEIASSTNHLQNASCFVRRIVVEKMKWPIGHTRSVECLPVGLNLILKTDEVVVVLYKVLKEMVERVAEDQEAFRDQKVDEKVIQTAVGFATEFAAVGDGDNCCPAPKTKVDLYQVHPETVTFDAVVVRSSVVMEGNFVADFA